MRITHFNADFKNAQDALRVTHQKSKIAHMKTGERIKQIRESKGLKILDVENRAGMSNGNLSRIENGKQWASEEKLFAIARALDVPVAELFAATPTQFDKNVKPLSGHARPVPVISPIQAGRLKEITDPYPPGAGFAQEYVEEEDNYSRWTFALEIDGLSMTPDFQPGDRVIIDPEISPNPGDFVVAKNSAKEATFKKYRARGIDGNGNMIFELVPLNPDFETMRSDVEHLEIIGVMVEHRKKRRPIGRSEKK